MGECRNCGSDTTRDLGFVGAVAPFVLKRVFNFELGFPAPRHPVKRWLYRFPAVRDGLRRLGPSALVEVQACTACSFIQTTLPFPEEGLSRLYVDYRADSYNEERIRYEPQYASIASQVGSADKELESRRGGLTAWLNQKIEIGSDFSMLDFGGAEGRFLPDLPAQKFVFDIAPTAPCEGVVKVPDESSLASYSYIQIAHVLEHVPFPLALTKRVASHLRPSGYLYVEVPQEQGDDSLARLASGDRTIPVTIHEHINSYSVASAKKLLQAAGLSVIAVEAADLDIGWIQCRVIRALGRKL